jgi:DNA primase
MDHLLGTSLALPDDDPLRRISIVEAYQYVTGLSGTTHRNGQHYIVRCPAEDHPDRHPSCSLNLGSDTWKCFACGKKGGKIQMVIEAEKARTRSEAAEWLKKTSGRLQHMQFTDQPALKPNQIRGEQEVLQNERLTGTYSYTDEKGNLVYQVQRFEGKGKNGGRDKRFEMRAPRAGGGWKKKLNGIRFYPYRLLDVLRAKNQKKSLIAVEGEKHADFLAKLKFHATTNAGGWGKDWDPKWLPYFEGIPVIFVIADSDKTGREAMKRRSALLEAPGRTVVQVDLFPDRNDGSDILDWVKEEGLTQLSAEQQRKHIIAKLKKYYEEQKPKSLPA